MVGILTKGIIPESTLDLLARYAPQVEGVAIGVSSLDPARNRALEPGCPPALQRLENVERIVARGLTAGVRLDPLFPELDDAPAALEALIAEAGRRRASWLIATYAFAWGPYLRRLRKVPLTAASCGLLTEKAPMAGGIAFSVPLTRKLTLYSLLAKVAGAWGMRFSTCGCKDLRVRAAEVVPSVCRNTDFLQARGVPVPCLTPCAAHPTPTP